MCGEKLGKQGWKYKVWYPIMGWATRESCPLCVAVPWEGSGSPCAGPELHPRLLPGMEPSAQSNSHSWGAVEMLLAWEGVKSHLPDLLLNELGELG